MLVEVVQAEDNTAYSESLNRPFPAGGVLMSSTEKDSKIALVIAIPVAGGRLCTHFGHCEQFALLDVDTAGKEILNSHHLTPPEQRSFDDRDSFDGRAPKTREQIVRDYLSGESTLPVSGFLYDD